MITVVKWWHREQLRAGCSILNILQTLEDVAKENSNETERVALARGHVHLRITVLVVLKFPVIGPQKVKQPL